MFANERTYSLYTLAALVFVVVATFLALFHSYGHLNMSW